MAANPHPVAAKKTAAAIDPLDLFDVRGSLTEEERLVQDSVARLVDAEVLPIIRKAFEEHRFPKQLIPKLAELGLLGSSIEGYDCGSWTSSSGEISSGNGSATSTGAGSCPPSF